MVDSQGNRPTLDGYFKATPETKRLAPEENRPGTVVKIQEHEKRAQLNPGKGYLIGNDSEY